MVVTRATNAQKHPGWLQDSSEESSSRTVTKPRKPKAQAEKDKADRNAAQVERQSELDAVEKALEEEQGSLPVAGPANVRSAARAVAQGALLNEDIIPLTPLHGEAGKRARAGSMKPPATAAAVSKP